ncbi:MAG: metallophosphoesterase family protein [Bacteroidetes bacterium]|nr:metallophosphoesterase family protein [Bacteroidota bacterium]
MKKICLLSDTHGYMDQRILDHCKSCDEIWHAGDIGAADVSNQLNAVKLLRAVYGNIDGREIRLMHAAELFFECEGIKVYITHIGGYPGAYVPEARRKIEEYRPDLFICGHSHILKVMPDKKYNLLHMNPGAAGKHGFHKIRTLLRFTLEQKKIRDVEAIELGLRGAIED